MIEATRTKVITSEDEKTKEVPDSVVVASEEVTSENVVSTQPVVYSFPSEAFSVEATSLEEAESALEAFKSKSNTN